MRFVAELRRRNVFKVAGVYLVTSWLIMQVVAVVQAPLHLPLVFSTVVTLLLALGLPLVCIFAWAYELTPEGMRRTSEVPGHASIREQTGERINRWLAVALLLALGFILLDKLWLSAWLKGEDSAGQPTPAIAVLPFTDMSADGSQEYFGDGMAEELLNALARDERLRVIARTSSFAFKHKAMDVRQIGTQLGVDYVLEGSVRKDAQRVRITAQLIDVTSGEHLWSDTYDRTLADIFALQEELTLAISRALEIRLLAPALTPIPGMTDNEHAYDLFLRGREISYQRHPVALQQAQKYLTQAIALDANFHQAKAHLYTVYMFMLDYGGGSYIQLSPRMDELFFELIAAPVDFAHKTLVMANHLSLQEQRPDLAATLFRRARQQAPNNAFIQHAALVAESRQGNHQAVVEGREALLRNNPLDPINYYNLIYSLYNLGRHEAARRYLDQLNQLAPDHSVTAMANILSLYRVDKDPFAALAYISNFSGPQNNYVKRARVQLLLNTGAVQQAAEELRAYLLTAPHDADAFFIQYVNLCYALGSDEAIAALNEGLSLPESFRVDANHTLALYRGDTAPYMTYWHNLISSPQELAVMYPERPSLVTFALLKQLQGDQSYAWAIRPFIRQSVLACERSNRVNRVDCPLMLYLDGQTDLQRLFEVMEDGLSYMTLRWMGVERYMLTAPWWAMLHEHPRFRPTVEAFLARTYEHWESEGARLKMASKQD